MAIAIVGHGAIASYVTTQLRQRNLMPVAVVARPGREATAMQALGLPALSGIDALPNDVSLVLDCAGHSALAAYGPPLLARGIDVITVSAGALASSSLVDKLAQAGADGGARVQVVAGSIGALDALAAAATSSLSRVSYRGIKPPAAWRGSPAENLCDLDRLTGSTDFYSGTARQAALDFPKNANVAAATALAGIGLDRTEVVLTADPALSRNRHEISAEGAFGRFGFWIEGQPLPESPGSSSLAAMSMVRAVVARGMTLWS
jgi:aspartate dehydrogenase